MSSQPISVTELNRLARTTLERGIALTWVLGEISNLTRAASGHLYFTLKDEGAQVRCVMFRSRAQLLPWRLENGQQVEAQALVTLYEARGDFQLNVDMLRRGGMGRLFEAFALLREKLEHEGLFDAARKRDIPRFPRAIGIVTSPQAAALRDVIAALQRRAPHVAIILYPTPVQGDGAAAQIANAIAMAGARAECEVLIVARGGGSIEDLWAFNEEIVARAIAASAIPAISGIGHETDISIADFVADQRAATPTAAAELASTGWFAAAEEIDALADELHATMHAALENRMQQVDLLSRRLLHPGARIARHRQHLGHLTTRLAAAANRTLRSGEQRLAELRLRITRARPDPAPGRARLMFAMQSLQNALGNSMLNRAHAINRLHASLVALNPEATLARGYSIVRDSEGHVVSSSKRLRPGDAIALRFAQGSAAGRIETTG